jgi:hypothetical protein
MLAFNVTGLSRKPAIEQMRLSRSISICEFSALTENENVFILRWSDARSGSTNAGYRRIRSHHFGRITYDE